eukprot:377792-Alexandrium_andersonii.AAC.1
MSASLVGSEMCIRDRSTSPARTRATPPSGEFGRRARRSARRTTLCLRRAVSYTHLTLPTICSV